MTAQEQQGASSREQDGHQAEQPAAQNTSKPVDGASESLFSRPEIKSHLKNVVLIFAAIGVGYGGSGAAVMSQLSDEQMMILGGVLAPAAISVLFFIPTIVGAIVTLSSGTQLSETGKDFYIVTAASVFAGGLVFLVLSTLLLGLEMETGLDLQGMIVPFVAATIPAAAASAGIAWTIDDRRDQ